MILKATFAWLLIYSAGARPHYEHTPNPVKKGYDHAPSGGAFLSIFGKPLVKGGTTPHPMEEKPVNVVQSEIDITDNLLKREDNELRTGLGNITPLEQEQIIDNGRSQPDTPLKLDEEHILNEIIPVINGEVIHAIPESHIFEPRILIEDIEHDSKPEAIEAIIVPEVNVIGTKVEITAGVHPIKEIVEVPIDTIEEIHPIKEIVEVQPVEGVLQPTTELDPSAEDVPHEHNLLPVLEVVHPKLELSMPNLLVMPLEGKPLFEVASIEDNLLPVLEVVHPSLELSMPNILVTLQEEPLSDVKILEPRLELTMPELNHILEDVIPISEVIPAVQEIQTVIENVHDISEDSIIPDDLLFPHVEELPTFLVPESFIDEPVVKVEYPKPLFNSYLPPPS